MKKITEEENFRITIEHHKTKVTIDAGTWEVDTLRVYELIKAALLASGWHPKQVKEILNETD